MLRGFNVAGIQVRLRDGDNGRLLGDGGAAVGNHVPHPRRPTSPLGWVSLRLTFKYNATYFSFISSLDRRKKEYPRGHFPQVDKDGSVLSLSRPACLCLSVHASLPACLRNFVAALG